MRASTIRNLASTSSRFVPFQRRRVAAIWWDILTYQDAYPMVETVEEAIANGREALRDCLEVFRQSKSK
jgi:hypothetical protein